ncbi:MAG: murein transglycosylase A [Campylobacterota bacterium]|nr:murein transglycosylase A [Campylobacterota bacterium]
MYNILILTIFSFIFIGCSQKATIQPQKSFAPELSLQKSSFDELPNWNEQEFSQIFNAFKKSCSVKKTFNKYPKACEIATTCNSSTCKDKQHFFENYFSPYIINDNESGMLTGYYEPLLHGSRAKSSKYRYPIYKRPKDLVEVSLGSLYPELSKRKYRGRLVGNKVVPYYSRANIKEHQSEVICYVDDEIELFFLEIQGSGRVKLDSGETIFVGYNNQNGHPYRAIGRYLINKKKISREDMSMQAIYKYLKNNPDEVRPILNYNPSVIFFSENKTPATGALGVELTPKHSVAVDRKFIPLGTLLYVDSYNKHQKVDINRVVIAQDVGGAIKGAVRADMFFGYGDDAMKSAGVMKEKLKLWMLLPKESIN